MTPMLRSHAMVNETAKRSNLIRQRNGLDHGALEEHNDTCCRAGCDRLGIWYSARGNAYCDGHWRRYKQMGDVHRINRDNGLCYCGGERVAGKATCRRCLNRRDGYRKETTNHLPRHRRGNGRPVGATDSAIKLCYNVAASAREKGSLPTDSST